MAGAVLPNGKNQFFATNGTVLAGGKLYTYAPGTSTPKAAYTNSAATVAHTNPIVLDSRGEAEIYWTGSYDVTLKTSADVTIWGPVQLDQPEISGAVDDAITQEQENLANATTAGLGDALVGWGAIVDIRDGVLTRHASLAAAVSSIGSTRCTVVVRDDITMAASATFPATATLRVENGARITTTSYTLTINGKFANPEGKQCFSGSGTVIFGKGAVECVCPQWWGAVGDGVIADGTGTDCTTAFQQAIAASCENGVDDVGIHPVNIGPGYFVIGALSLPPAVRIYGAGRHMTNLIAKTGTSGVWIGDDGNAAKIVLEGFAMYGRSLTGITHGIQLGQTVQHGTEGHLRDLFVRDIDGSSAVWGIDVSGNVGYYDWLTTYDCKSGIKITGTANMASKIAPYECTTTGLEIDGTDVHGVEIEAPGNSCLPLKITGSASVIGCTVSLANSTTISHLVELGGSATTWEVRNFRLVFGNTPAGITVSNGNFKRSDGTYFGGNATAGSQDGEGHYSSEHNGGKYTSFVLRVINTAGTLQHRICGPDGTASNFASAINGASASLTNTPTGTDSSTAMAAGGKISSAATSIFVLDTKAQRAGDNSFSVGEVQTSTGDNIRAIAYPFSINVNGTTRTRLVIQFVDAVLGTAYALNTSNLGAGEYVQASFTGWITH